MALNGRRQYSVTDAIVRQTELDPLGVVVLAGIDLRWRIGSLPFNRAKDRFIYQNDFCVAQFPSNASSIRDRELVSVPRKSQMTWKLI